MSAGQVQLLEDLLARVQKNRELPGLRLQLAHEAWTPQPSAPTAAPLDAEPPSTKDFGEPSEEPAASPRPDPETLALGEDEPAAPEARELAASEAAAAESAPEVAAAADDAPVIEASESSPEIVLDAAEEVYLDDIPSEEPSTVDPVAVSEATVEISQEREAVTQPRPTHPRPERIAQEEAVAAATREPVTEPRPPAPSSSDISDEPTAEPETRDPVAAEPAPPTAAPITKVSLEPPASDGVPRSAVDPNAITSKRDKKLELDGSPAPAQAKKPPPLPGSDTVVSSPPAAAASAEAGETEITTPQPPEAAPAIAARQAVKPRVIAPQIVRTAQVAEMIGEIAAMKPTSFGRVIDDALSLAFP